MSINAADRALLFHFLFARLGQVEIYFLVLVIVPSLALILQGASCLRLLPQHPIDPLNRNCASKLVRRALVAFEDTH